MSSRLQDIASAISIVEQGTKRCAKVARMAAATAGLVLIVTMLNTAKAKAQVGLDPMVIQTEVSRGQAQSVITVTNPSNKAMRVRVYAHPFTYEREAGFTELTEDANDLTPYLQFSPREFVIPPNERQRVRVVGLLPPSLSETEYRAVIFTEALPENRPTTGSSAGIQTRIGSTVYFRQAETEATLTIMNAQWNPETDHIQLLVNNTGEATARPNVKWTLQQNGADIASGETGSTTIIEGRDRLFQLPYDSEALGAIAPGDYELTGELVWRFENAEQFAEPFSTVLTVSP